MIRVELLIALAGFALDHGDQGKALELVSEARAVLDGGRWRLEDRVALLATLAELRSRSGDAQRARADADAARSLFAAEREKIVNIYRARALRPLAEAYRAMDDVAAALTVYKQAVEEGVANPNSRPRAEDLSATCTSLAVHGVEPDAELWTRIRQICAGLGQPW
jgi:hypothetical protein